MTRIVADVRYALRMLRKAPGASAVAIVSLALGIAINTTVFGWIRGILLDPVPAAADAGRLVTIETVTPSGALIDSSFPDYQSVRDESSAFAGVIAFKERPVGLAVGTAAAAEHAWALAVTGNYFDVLGVKPALGRFFDADEQRDALDAHPVAVLGHDLWRARLHADPAIVGRPIALNRRPYTVIGIAPERFAGTISGLRFDLYVPLTMVGSLTGTGPWLTSRGSRPLYLFGRLNPNVTVEPARTDTAAVARRAAEQFPDTNSGISLTVLPLLQAKRGASHDLGPLLQILLATTAIVLLIVCANLANLQLARGMARRREIGVRLGLGASRGVVLRQMLTEGLVMAVLALGVGVLASAWLADALRWLLPFERYPVALPTAMHAPDVAFAPVVSIAAMLLFALVPALCASSTDIVAAIGIGRASDDSRTARLSGALVVAQVALAMAALVSAALLARSFGHARQVNPGFNARNVLLAGVDLSTAGYSRDEGMRYLDRLMDRVSTLPGVERAAYAEDVPLGFDGGSWEDVAIDGYVPRPGESMKIYRNLVSPGTSI